MSLRISSRIEAFVNVPRSDVFCNSHPKRGRLPTFSPGLEEFGGLPEYISAPFPNLFSTDRANSFILLFPLVFIPVGRLFPAQLFPSATVLLRDNVSHFRVADNVRTSLVRFRGSELGRYSRGPLCRFELNAITSVPNTS